VDLCWLGDDSVVHGVDKVLLLRITGEVGEGQNGDRVDARRGQLPLRDPTTRLL
jgi:hypothetical protein